MNAKMKRKIAQLIVLSIIGIGVVVLYFPFFQIILVAAVLTAAFYPWLEYVDQRLRMPHNLLVILSSVLLGLTTIIFISALIFHGIEFSVKEATEAVSNTGQKSAAHNIQQWFDFDLMLKQISFIFNLDPSSLQKNLSSVGKHVVDGFVDIIKSILSNIPLILLKLIMIWALFYGFSRYAESILWVIYQASPFSKKNTKSVLDYGASLSRFLILSSLVTGFVQALIMGLACLIGGVDQIVSIMVLVFFFSFVPFIGTTPVSVVVIIAELLAGSNTAAVIVMIGSLIMGASDNIIRSLFIARYQFLPSIVAFVSLLTGILVFGPLGIITAPIITGIAWKVMKIWVDQNKASRLHAA